MAEAFVKTFKRDYVRCNPCPDAITVLGQLDIWFTDYNESHHHKALKMLSPREFIQANLIVPHGVVYEPWLSEVG
jgi:putative transposase